MRVTHLQSGGDHVALGLDGSVAAPYDGVLVDHQRHGLLGLMAGQVGSVEGSPRDGGGEREAGLR